MKSPKKGFYVLDNICPIRYNVVLIPIDFFVPNKLPIKNPKASHKNPLIKHFLTGSTAILNISS